MGPGESPRRGRGRPRTPGAEEKILHAALEEYGERGWAGFTMDAVARRAGVGKSTVYLRWPDKDALLTDAVRHRTGMLAAIDTGSLRGDLEKLTASVFADLADAEGWANFRVIIDTASAPQPLGTFSEEVGGVHREIIREIFQRAADRGEVSRPVSPFAVTDLLYGAALFFTLSRRLEGQQIDEDMIATRVAEVLSVVLDGLIVD